MKISNSRVFITNLTLVSDKVQGLPSGLLPRRHLYNNTSMKFQCRILIPLAPDIHIRNSFTSLFHIVCVFKFLLAFSLLSVHVISP